MTKPTLDSASVMAVRVLHVIESLQPRAGSVAISLPGLLRVLETRGINCTVVARDSAGWMDKSIGVNAFDPTTTAQLVKQAQVVHSHGWGDDLSRRVAELAQKAGKPFVISPLGALGVAQQPGRGWFDGWRRRLRDRSIVRRAAGLVVLNQDEEKQLRTDTGHHCITLLPYGLSLSEYEGDAANGSDLPDSPPGRCLLVLGPIGPNEGCVHLLKAFAALGADSDGWSVVLAGPATNEWDKMLEAAVRRKGGAGRVLITPAPDVATQRAWLARASLLVAPSAHVRFPISVMQAVAAGVPVVASRAVVPPGLEKVVRVWGPGQEDLQRALRSVLELSDSQRAELGAKAQVAGRELFDWPVLVEPFVKLYTELAA